MPKPVNAQPAGGPPVTRYEMMLLLGSDAVSARSDPKPTDSALGRVGAASSYYDTLAGRVRHTRAAGADERFEEPRACYLCFLPRRRQGPCGHAAQHVINRCKGTGAEAKRDEAEEGVGSAREMPKCHATTTERSSQTRRSSALQSCRTRCIDILGARSGMLVQPSPGRAAGAGVPKYARTAKMGAGVYVPILTAGAAHVPKSGGSTRGRCFCCYSRGGERVENCS